MNEWSYGQYSLACYYLVLCILFAETSSAMHAVEIEGGTGGL